jgi:glycosyltransferase involved in cell wall biosynthesis
MSLVATPLVDSVRVFRSSTALPHVRVLHVIHGEHYAGAERVQDLLVGQLPLFGFDAGLACVKPGRFLEVFESRGASLYEVPMAGRIDLRAAAGLAAIVRRQGYRLLHTHTPRTAMVGAIASAMTGVPMVHHVHSPASRDSTHVLRNRVNALVERASLCRASALIAVSQSLGRQVQHLARPDRLIAVVPNGVPRRLVRRPRRPEEAAWTLGTVALFRPRKGIEVLLESLAQLRAQGIAVRLRAVGGFETAQYHRQVMVHAAQLGVSDAVEWIGFTRNVDAELCRMDLLVLPSLFGEGLPMVVLEAMAAGVPVVATEVEGIPEAVRDGVEGLLAAPGDAASLSHAVGRIVRGEVPWTRLHAAALQRHAQLYSDDTMAAGVAEVYRQVLASRP